MRKDKEEKMRSTRIIISSLSLLFVFGLTTDGPAQDFPTKSIRYLIPYAAGGGTDVLARAFQKPLGEALGTKIVVQNIPGGSTKLATMELMKAKPDGYTLLQATPQSLLAHYYSGTYDFKPWETLTHIGNITKEAYAFFETRVDLPWKTWGELVQYAKQHPEKKITFGMPTTGGIMWVFVYDAAKASGIEVKCVPFEGATGARNALLGGHVDLTICQTTEAIVMIRAGKTRGLAISSDERLKELPDVPTFKELGLGESISMNQVVHGPANMPQNIVDIIAKAMQKAVKDPAFNQFCEKMIYPIKFMDGQSVKNEAIKFNERFGEKIAAYYKK